MKWYPFDRMKGYRQKRPPVRKHVLVRFAPRPDTGQAPIIAVGYMKNAAGDKSCPYFVTPGIGGDPTHWCDCLPADLNLLWQTTADKS